MSLSFVHFYVYIHYDLYERVRHMLACLLAQPNGICFLIVPAAYARVYRVHRNEEENLLQCPI